VSRGAVTSSLAELVDPLCRVHDWIRDAVLAACEYHTTSELAAVAAQGAGDVTFEIDRVSESALVERLAAEIAERDPIVLVGEGLPNGKMVLPEGTREADAAWRVIVDPIDGTRCLMYQKRPGWILTGVAPNRGHATTLDDIELAVQTEIPLVKQHLSDQLWAVRGGGAQGIRRNRLTGESSPLALQPSTATDLRNGFVTFSRFFPGGRDVLSAIDDALSERLLGRRTRGEAAVFEDQYACTGGQLYGLIIGQDRFVADLRPLVERIVLERGQALGHCCHPYDLCTKLIAEEAGVIVTGASGGPVIYPLDTESDVAWIGYANAALREHIEPALVELLREHQLLP
jgi:fructose-1,6-bisphosphatase/inositol monophosphatase family enzyme